MRIAKYLSSILIAHIMLFSFVGCRPAKPRPGETPAHSVISEESQPVTVYGYESSVSVKAKPDELVNHVLKDFSWLKKASSIFKFKIVNLRPDTDMTQLGQSLGINIRIMGINFPCEFVTLRYKPEKELWVIILTDGSWLLIRSKVDLIPEGSMMEVNAIGKPSPSMGSVVDTLQLAKAIPGWVDKFIASIQSEFDPELNIEELTGKGLRGEPFEKFLQGHEARVRVNAPPEKVEAWITDPANIPLFAEEIVIEKSDLVKYQQAPSDAITYAPATIKAGVLRPKADVFFIKKEKGKEYVTRMFIVVYNIIGSSEVEITPEGGGSLLKLRMEFEIPTHMSADSMDLLLFWSGYSKLIQEKIQIIKEGVERG